MATKIKDVEVVEVVTGEEKIPVSNGSDLAVAITVNLIIEKLPKFLLIDLNMNNNTVEYYQLIYNTLDNYCNGDINDLIVIGYHSRELGLRPHICNVTRHAFGSDGGIYLTFIDTPTEDGMGIRWSGRTTIYSITSEGILTYERSINCGSHEHGYAISYLSSDATLETVINSYNNLLDALYDLEFITIPENEEPEDPGDLPEEEP